MDVWTDIQALNPMSRERTGYPTQKPLSLLHRIIKASSNEGGIVLDPFCGCATTCVAAHQLGRRWIGIDIEERVAAMLADRLGECPGADAGGLFDHVRELPERTDIVAEAHSDRVRRELREAQGGRCAGCGGGFDIDRLGIACIIPRSKGGSETRRNHQLLCGDCARIKGGNPLEYLRRKVGLLDEGLARRMPFGR